MKPRPATKGATPPWNPLRAAPRVKTRGKSPLVTAAVIEKDGAVLVALRKNTDRFGGVWEFPGGKVEPGELPEDGLRRELKEELGVETSIGPFLGSFPYTSEHIDIELLAYRVSIQSGRLELHDHEEVRWVRTADLGDFHFAEPDRPLVEILMRSPAHPAR